MMATVLLSQHSSNPLEVPSSDINNSKQLRQIETAGGLVSSDDNVDPFNFPAEQNHRSLLSQWNPKMTHASSKKSTVDDNVDPFNFPVQNHRSLLSQWNPKMTHALSKKSTVGNMSPPHMVDLDEDMSDGETQPLEAEDVCCDDGSAYQNEEDEDEEEKSIFLKPPDEREQIREEILDLEEAVPQLGDEYKIIDRLGTGTFSSVYKAIDLWHHTKWDNTLWHGFHPPESSAHYHRQNWSKVFVAIKRIYVTSGPERIRNELSVMEDCRGCRHVSQLVTAFRHHDQVVAVMPYHRNEDFRDYYRLLSLDGMRAYLRCMFRALRDVHSRGVIHRDVKPANFLFDPHTGIGTLCDFGLACRMEPGPTLGACLHTGPSPEAPHGRIKPRTDYDPDLLRQMRKEANYRSTQQSEKVGYPDKDTRPHSKANRAGTRGFRAPEVLLKCGEQSGAIDVWSTGIIFLFFLTAKFPLFQSSDDIEALMELATIFGRRRMERTATLHSRTFATNLPSVNPEGLSWSEFVQRLNPNLMVPRKPDTRFNPYSNHVPTGITAPPPSSSSSSPPPSFHSSPRSSSTSTSKSRPVLRDSSPSSPTAERHKTDMLLALDLVEKLLDPDATKRPTPREVLNHSFLSEDDEGIDDDDYFPQPFGGGVCGEWHFYDETTGEPCVQVKLKDGTMDVKRLVSGEGIAIGRQPCEFHSDYFDVN